MSPPPMRAALCTRHQTYPRKLVHPMHVLPIVGTLTREDSVLVWRAERETKEENQPAGTREQVGLRRRLRTFGRHLGLGRKALDSPLFEQDTRRSVHRARRRTEEDGRDKSSRGTRRRQAFRPAVPSFRTSYTHQRNTGATAVDKGRDDAVDGLEPLALAGLLGIRHLGVELPANHEGRRECPGERSERKATS